jgi:hypothetical protein
MPEVRLVRGDEIIEVHYQDVTSGPYPSDPGAKPIEGGRVSVVQARTPHADGGTCPHRIVLWDLPNVAAAEAAATRLMTLLCDGEGSGVVLYSPEHHEVRRVSFEKLHTVDLSITGLTVPDDRPEDQ